MYIIDFEYDGEYLSDYGFVPCRFEEAGGINTTSAGSKITFNRVSRNRGRVQSLLGTQFDETISATFAICKDPDGFEQTNMELTTDEIRTLMRWLNRHDFLCFRPIFQDDWCGTLFHLNASFNIEKISVAGKVYGLELTMFTDSPYAYGEEECVSFNLSPSNHYTFTDRSDEICYSSPVLKIKCGENGNLKISNTFTKCALEIAHCAKNEVLVIDNAAKTITSSVASHDVYNDFNYDFFSIGNSYRTRQNRITSSLSCSVELRYKPIVKLSL